MWEKHIEELGTRASFLKDPLGWYNEFWLPNFAPLKLAKAPNAGHEALALLSCLLDDLRIVTQNVDGLHQSTAIGWDSSERLIEAHGRAGLYKCGSDPEVADGEEKCPYSEEKTILPEQFSEEGTLRLQFTWVTRVT